MTSKLTEAQIATMADLLIEEINEHLHAHGTEPTDRRRHDGDTT